jgi:hypothetical protein
LRIAILDAFDEGGITSPLPRTDVTLRNIDWLHGMVAEYASAASNGRTTPNGSHGLRYFPEHDDQSVQPRRNGGPTSS